MNDINQVVGQQISEGQQEAPMPSAIEKPAENSEGRSTQEEVSARTREQFEKLKQANLELSRKLENYERSQKSSSVFDIFNAGVQEQSVPDVTDDFGDIDESKYAKVLAEQQRKTEQALRLARETQEQLKRQEQAKQESEAMAKFPWLDPNSPHRNDDAIEMVKAQAVLSYANGQSVDLVRLAEKVDKFLKPQTVVDQNKVNNQKIASAPIGGNSHVPTQNFERKIDPNSLAERIRRATTK